MKIPRDLFGREFADHLIRRWGYREERQLGSHIILVTDSPSPQTVAIPAHKPMRIGTLAALLRMVADHKRSSRDEILRGL